ncbi:MAG TPA: hypothetical protein VGI61_01445 [Parafilimonas sp.]
MKKIATILLLSLLLFNFIGYRFVFNALQAKADKELTANLDRNNYNEADLITITVPLSMPYLTDSKDFERKDGEIILNGKIYHYVKQKISNGNLILKCLPDVQKMQLQTAKNDFFKNQTDLQNNSSSKKSNDNGRVIKLVLSDYEQLQNSSIHFYSTGITNSYSSFVNFATQKGEGVMPEQPPEA